MNTAPANTTVRTGHNCNGPRGAALYIRFTRSCHLLAQFTHTLRARVSGLGVDRETLNNGMKRIYEDNKNQTRHTKRGTMVKGSNNRMSLLCLADMEGVRLAQTAATPVNDIPMVFTRNNDVERPATPSIHAKQRTHESPQQCHRLDSRTPAPLSEQNSIVAKPQKKGQYTL